MNPIQAALAAVTIGPGVKFENLTMLPLLGGRSGDAALASASYVLLDDALTSSAAEITEVSKDGSVPELRFVNRGKVPVLIIDGQELLGAKQNRVVNLTILVPAHTTLTIPVSCVESGRWNSRSRAFSAAPRTQYASGRAKRVAQVTQSLLDRGERVSDQAEVWADIAFKSARLDASSSTGAMEVLFERHAAFIERCVDALKPVDGQVGAIFFINHTPVALDLFDRPDTLQRLLPKLVRSIAVDALDESSNAMPGAASLPSEFVARISSAAQHSTKAVGIGEDVRLSSASLAGAALVVDDAIVHVSAFASV